MTPNKCSGDELFINIIWVFIVFISLLAFMPFRVQRNEPAAKRRSGEEKAARSDWSAYGRLPSLLKNRRALRKLARLRHYMASLTSRAFSVSF
jgi:hypothetical protein